MNKVKVVIENAGANLSAYVEGAPIISVGNNIAEIESNIKEAISLYLDSCKDLNIAPAECLSGTYQLDFHLDAATFINYYSGIFTKAALSRITGINERQLWFYATGAHKPRQKQTEKIQKGIAALANELSSISLS